MKIKILGAFDRYNYGDLLFPIILEKYLDDVFKENSYKLYSITNGDLSKVGGLRTLAMSDFYLDIEDNDIVIVAGGEIICASAKNLSLDSTKSYIIYYIKKIIYKILGFKLANMLSKAEYKLNNDYPFIIEKKKFNKDFVLIYNTVGGHSLSFDNKLSVVKRSLKENVDYISVRDKITFDSLINEKKYLYPDSAMLMSEYFSKEDLKKLMNKEVLSICENNKYICFQINNGIYKENKKEVLDLIKAIKDKYKVILLPIGFANNHDDLIALNKIKKIYDDLELFKELTIFDIMGLIAFSECFIGTSLHGNITAMSYSVPYVGINKNIKKLNEFLHTWGVAPSNKCVEINEVDSMLTKLVGNSGYKEKLKINRDNLVKLAYENFKNIENIIIDSINKDKKL